MAANASIILGETSPPGDSMLASCCPAYAYVNAPGRTPIIVAITNLVREMVVIAAR